MPRFPRAVSAVRATLRSFAVQPSRARRYCLIDGRDSNTLFTDR